MRQFRRTFLVIALIVIAITFFVGNIVTNVGKSNSPTPEPSLLQGQDDAREIVRKGMVLKIEPPKKPIRMSAPQAYKKVEPLYTVPNGKRLVIEQISGNSEVAKVTLGIAVSQGIDSKDSGFSYYMQGTPQSIGYVAHQLTRIYADSGAIVSAIVDPGDTPPRKEFISSVAFSGYLVDVKEER